MNPVAPVSATSGCAAAPVDGTVTSGLPQEATLQHSVAFSSHFLRWCPHAVYQQITTGTELWGAGRDLPAVPRRHESSNISVHSVATEIMHIPRIEVAWEGVGMVPKYSAEWWEKVAARPFQKLEGIEPATTARAAKRESVGRDSTRVEPKQPARAIDAIQTWR